MFCSFTIRLTVCCSIGNQTLSTKNRAYQVLHQCLVLFALFTFCLCFVATSWILRACLTWTFCFFRCVVCWNPLSWQVVSALNRLGAISMTFSGAEHWCMFICSGGLRYPFAYFSHSHWSCPFKKRTLHVWIFKLSISHFHTKHYI